jgi:hypothetical protein
VISWLRRLDAWLEAIGIRRSVLLAVGSAGSAAAVVALVGAVQVGHVAAAAGRAGPAGPVAATQDLNRLEAAFWRARFASVADAGDLARSRRDVAAAVAGYRAQPLTSAERAALAAFTRRWDATAAASAAGPTAAGDAAGEAGDAAASALATLSSTARRASAAPAAPAGVPPGVANAGARATALLVLIFCLGVGAASALVRLIAVAVAGRARRMLAAARGAIKAPSGPRSPEGPPSTSTAPPVLLTATGLDEAARAVAAAGELIRVTARRIEQRERLLSEPAPSSAEEDAQAGWWVRPVGTAR